MPSLPLIYRCAPEARQPEEWQSHDDGAFRGVADMTDNILEDKSYIGSSGRSDPTRVRSQQQQE